MPQHVALRVVTGIPSLRRERTVAAICDAIGAVNSEAFRVVHFSVMSNHVHLIVEAAGREALTRGMQRLAIRIALRVNAAMGRRGNLFVERYHARPLRTPREVRNAIRYVLLNARHHFGRDHAIEASWIDPCSSGPWFDGWSEPTVRAPTGCPTAVPRTWMLTVGWRRHGLIEVDGRATA